MDEHHTLSALAMQLALAGDLCALAWLVTLTSGETGRFFPLILLAYAPAIYGLDRLYLRSPRTMLGLAILNAVMGSGLFLSICAADGRKSWETMVFIGFFCLWPSVQAGKLALEPPKLHSMILCLDASVVVLALFTAYTSATGFSFRWSIPAAAGCTAAVLGVISLRINRRMGPRDWGSVLLAFGAIFAGMLLVMGFVAAPAGQGVVALWNGLVSLVRFLFRLLMQLLLFLTSLFDPAESGELPPVQPIPLPGQEQTAAEANPLAVAVLIGLFLALLLCLAGYLLYRLSRLRIGGRRVSVPRTGVARRLPSLRKALRRLLTALTAHLRLCAFLWRERNTPRGLFLLLIRRCRTGPWHKRTGETPREFLTRLRDSARDDPELSAALEALIPAVDRALYAPGHDSCRIPAARLIRRRVGTAVRRQFLRDCLAALRSRAIPHPAAKSRSPEARKEAGAV